MPLNLTTGEFVPYLKYNAKAGRFYIKNEAGEDVEVEKPKLIFDFANIKTGWIFFPPGSAPIKVWDRSLTEMAPKPPEHDFKRGFEVIVSSPDLGDREFLSNSISCNTAIKTMYGVYEASKEGKNGSSPIFQCVGVKPITGQHGTNYEPQFKLVGWTGKDPLDDEIPF